MLNWRWSQQARWFEHQFHAVEFARAHSCVFMSSHRRCAPAIESGRTHVVRLASVFQPTEKRQFLLLFLWRFCKNCMAMRVCIANERTCAQISFKCIPFDTMLLRVLIICNFMRSLLMFCVGRSLNRSISVSLKMAKLFNSKWMNDENCHYYFSVWFSLNEKSGNSHFILNWMKNHKSPKWIDSKSIERTQNYRWCFLPRWSGVHTTHKKKTTKSFSGFRSKQIFSEIEVLRSE